MARLRQALRDLDLQRPDAGIVLGASGGPDSTALLIAAAAVSITDASGPRFVAAHVHHHLRGADADEDAAFTARLAARLGLPFQHRDVHPAACGDGLAAAARHARYAALGAVARAEGATAVAVAHHAGDQLETMLWALVRGTEAAGLAGMPVRRGLGDAAEGVDLVRPFLEVDPSALADLCGAADIEPRHDPSNDDRSRARAAIRHDIVPRLDALRPDAARRAGRTARCLRELLEARDALVVAAFGPEDRRVWSRADLRQLPPTLVSAGIRRAATRLVPAAGAALAGRDLDHLARLVLAPDAHPRAIDLPEALRVVIDATEVRLDRASNGDPRP